MSPESAQPSQLAALHLDAGERAGRGRSGFPWLRWLLVLGALGGGLWVYGHPAEFGLRVRELATARVALTYPSETITLFTSSGYVVPQTRAQVASKATGRLEAIEVREGDRVEAGQLLARVENADLVAAQAKAAANLAVARAQVLAMRAQVLEAKARIDELAAESRDAARALKRAEGVAKDRYIAAQELDAAIARDEKARASVRRAEVTVGTVEAALVTAEAQVQAAEAALREADVAVDYTQIRAPFKGVVLEKFADLGDVVAPFAATASSKGAVVTLADLETLEVEADVSEASLLKAQVGQPAEIALDALPEVRLRGRVRQVVPTVDRSKATVLVKVAFVDQDPRVLPEMSARIAFLRRELEFEEHTPKLTIQSEAVLKNNGGAKVWRLREGQVEAVTVQLGAPMAGLEVITEGLAEGDEVVRDPPADFKPGDRVTAKAVADD